MSAAPRLPAILASITAATASTIILLLPRQYLPTALSSRLPPSVRGPILKALALLLCYLNLKNLPFAWHLRVLRAIYYQIYTSPFSLSGRDLFRPLVTTTWNTPLDCDYNLHKSNSTYFADLDVARAHFVGALLRTSLRRLNAGDREGLPQNARETLEKIEAQGRAERGDGSVEGAGGKKSKVPNFYIIALGGVACVFRKEIKPLEKFEIWTRLLCWDRKWIYVVSHMVKAGAVKPKGYYLQPWAKEGEGRFRWHFSGNKELPERSLGGIKEEIKDLEKDMKSAVFATSIAKYVCKKGRLTIAPELVLQRSYLLPTDPKPENMPDLVSTFVESARQQVNGTSGSDSGSNGENGGTAQSETDLLLVSRSEINGTGSLSGTQTPSSNGLSSPEGPVAAAPGIASALGSSGVVPSSSASASGSTASQRPGQEVDTMTWEEVETMRVRGLKYAEMFDGLTGLHDEFGKDGSEVVGVYPDFLY